MFSESLYFYIIQKEREQQLVQAKDRELAQTQQQLRYQVRFVCVCIGLHVLLSPYITSLCTGAVQQKGD